MIFVLIEEGHFSVYWSFVLDYENSHDPVSGRRAFVQYLSQCCESTIKPDEPIRELARNLFATHQVRGRDALHLACADLSGCEFLLTCDYRLVKQGKSMKEQGTVKVKVINPVDFLKEV